MMQGNRSGVWCLAVILMLFQNCTTDDAAKPAVEVKSKCYLLKSTATNSANDYISERVYTINADGKVTDGAYTVKNSTSTNSSSEKYYYDPTGKLTKLEGANYYNTYSYNTSNQLTNVTYYVDNAVISTTNMQYNTSGQVIKKTYASKYTGALTYSGYRVYTYPGTSSKNANKETFYNTKNEIQFYVEYEYDTNFNPLATIEIDRSITVPSVNNITKSTYTQLAGASSVNISTSNYSYNDKEYPTQEIRTAYSIVTTTNFVYDCK